MKAYTIQDVVAGIFAKTTVKDLGFKGEEIRDMVRLIQEPDEEALRHAYILTVKTRPGLMRHVFMSNDRIGCGAITELFGLPDGEFSDGAELIRFLEEARRLISRATLYQITQAILKELYEKYTDGRLAATSAAAT